MDCTQIAIFLKGQEKTGSIAEFEMNQQKCYIRFVGSEKLYQYDVDSVQIYELQGTVDVGDKRVLYKNGSVCDVKRVLDFGEYYRFVHSNTLSQLYPKEDVEILESCQKSPVDVLIAYFNEAANVKDDTKQGDESINHIKMQYDRMKHIDSNSVLAQYFEPNEKNMCSYPLPSVVIYPFGLNQSQKTAVEQALQSQISIIQGPPGTGKTQTILNILSNLILQKKTVTVVSNNNTAVSNIIEKLDKKDLSFFTALLGKNDNIEKFVQGQTGEYPSMVQWQRCPKDIEQLRQEIPQILQTLTENIKHQNRIAEINQQLLQLEPELYYFTQCYNSYRNQRIESLDPLKKLNSRQILSIWLDYENHTEQQKRLTLLKKICITLKFDVHAIHLFMHNPEVVIPYLQNQFYTKLQWELTTEKQSLENRLKRYSFLETMQQLTDKSLQLLYAQLSSRYPWQSQRRKFDKNTLKSSWKVFIQEYPVVFSSTHSIKKTLNQFCPDYLFDYIIIDESSQVDLRTAVLSLACAKNVVIVGDDKQLPPVLTTVERQEFETIEQDKFSGSKYGCYMVSKESLMSSALQVWNFAPTTLLREHYRCHPKIINFCNQKFYDGQLIIMTEDNKKTDALKLYFTRPGNHARHHQNQRQIDIIQQEILPTFQPEQYSSIGIIAPYADQIRKIQTDLGEPFEIATVHSFQGREKDTIIISSVDNQITKFVDDPQLLNVAISRAIQSLVVVVSPDPKNETTNYGHLMRYIQYNQCEIVQSKVYSVFDLLYRQYTEQRKKFLEKHKRISAYNSENLLYGLLQDILSQSDFSLLDCACHVSLINLIPIHSTNSVFTPEEKEFIKNKNSHVDFLVFQEMDKFPLLAIEVDGVSYHSSSVQKNRDEKKNRILEKSGIKLLRLSTDGSNEKQKIQAALLEAMAPSLKIGKEQG